MTTAPLHSPASLQPAPYRLRFDLVILIAFLYLALPNILFLFGWCELWVSIPVTAGILYAMVQLFRKRDGETIPLTRRDLLKIGLVVLIVCIQQIMVGYTGNVIQNEDFWQRNAFYGNLIDYPWPIILPDGRELTYYIASWLPPALMSKIAALFGCATDRLHGIPGILLYLWNSTAIVLTILVSYGIMKRISLLFVFFMLALDGSFSYMLLSYLTPLTSFIYVNLSIPQFLGIDQQLLSTINHAPATLLATALILVPKRPIWFYPLSGSLLLLLSPLGAVGLLPFLCYSFFKKLHTASEGHMQKIGSLLRSIPVWTAGTIALVAALYYARANTSHHLYWSLSITGTPGDSLRIIFLTVIVLLFLFYIPLRRQRSTPLYIALAIFATLPFLYMGDINNELLFKAILPTFLVLSLAWTQAVTGYNTKKPSWFEILIMTALVLKFASSCGYKYRNTLSTFTTSDRTANVINPFEGHLYHPGTALSQSIPTTKPAAIPHIFYTKAGESETGLLRWCPTKPCDKYQNAPAHNWGPREYLKHPFSSSPEFPTGKPQNLPATPSPTPAPCAEAPQDLPKNNP